MGTHFERTFEKDLERIQEKITRMAALDEEALLASLKALEQGNRQLAYSVILGDRRVDEMEREVDQLCLEFLVRQQPVAGPLRFAYSTIRINLELERIGDYAESIARQVLKLIGLNADIPIARLKEIANLSIPMLRDAVRAFVSQDAALASRTMRVEETVDELRAAIDRELYELQQKGQLPLAALAPLMTITRRFERVSDQAKNICQEAIYCATGQYSRHLEEKVIRLLFVDEHDACRAPLAAAICNSLRKLDVFCASAGVEPRPLDSRLATFLAARNLDFSQHQPRALKEVADLERFHVIVGLAKDVQRLLPAPPRKTVYLDWSVSNPSLVQGDNEHVRQAYEETCQEIESHIIDLLKAMLGE